MNFYFIPNYEMKIKLESGPIQNVEVLKGGEIKQSGITVHVGHTVEINGSTINVPRPDRNVTENEIMIDLDQCFHALLKGFDLGASISDLFGRFRKSGYTH